MAASPGRRSAVGLPTALRAPPSQPSGRGFIWTPSGLKASAPSLSPEGDQNKAPGRWPRARGDQALEGGAGGDGFVAFVAFVAKAGATQTCNEMNPSRPARAALRTRLYWDALRARDRETGTEEET